jgi:acetylornithine/succinyldiaminopimelate/putrescine aminotransferase
MKSRSERLTHLLSVDLRADAALLCFLQCGLYRSGTMWAHSPMPVSCHPDIITMAKPLANGYPIGAVLMRDAIAQTMTAGQPAVFSCARRADC